MRMRPKKNRDARMEKVNHLFIPTNEDGVVQLDGAYDNNNEFFLEIGCGKGGFIIEVAKREPSVNYIALEKMSNVILTPLEEVNFTSFSIIAPSLSKSFPQILKVASQKISVIS